MLFAKGQQCGVNGVKAKLVVFYQNQLTWPLLEDLATKLPTDASPCASHQHNPSHLVAREQCPVWWHRFATQQILDVQFLKILDGHLARGQIDHRWQGAHMYRQRAEARDDRL